MLLAPRPRGTPPAPGLAAALAALGAAAAAAVPAAAQPVARPDTLVRATPVEAGAPAPAPAEGPRPDRWTLMASYLHANAAPIRRAAEPSMSVTASRALGRDPRRGLRAEAGWLRASRAATQAQGATLGLSWGVPVRVRGRGAADPAMPRALTLRPGLAALAGWAEAQAGDTLYAWRGLPGTPYAGQTGAVARWYPVRGRTTGVGAGVAADLRLSRGVALTGAVQRWAFTGSVIRPNRAATLAGVGVALRPRSFAADTRAWWHTATHARPAGAEVAR